MQNAKLLSIILFSKFLIFIFSIEHRGKDTHYLNKIEKSTEKNHKQRSYRRKT